MQGRISVWILTLPLALVGAGCVTTNQSKNIGTPASTNFGAMREAPKAAKRDDGAKRDPQPSTEVAFGRMKELEAEGDLAKKNPEAQARLRDEARRAYQKALKLDPGNLEATRSLGRLYTRMGDYPRAQEMFGKAMAKHPKDASLWYDVGLMHHRKRELNESVRCFQRALDLDPENREYMKKLGFTLAYLGNEEQGLAYLTRAQGAALGHYNLACVLLHKDQTIRAQQHLRLALRENSQLQDARILLMELETPTGGTGRPANRQISGQSLGAPGQVVQ